MSIVIPIVIIFLIGLIIMVIESFKDSRLKSILDVYDPDTKQTKITYESAINGNIAYVTKEIKRMLPEDGSLEMSVTYFILKQKKRNPFEVHDILYSTAKYLSTLTKATIAIVYDNSFMIRRKTSSGQYVTLDKDKDQMIALCVHWFIWQYSSNPYELDQGFNRIAASTNLLYGRMYGYQDAKDYHCSVDCWESYAPYCEYTNGKTNGIEFSVARSQKPRFYINILSHEEEHKDKDDFFLKTKRDFNELLLIQGLDSENLFYQIIPDLIKKACFTNYGRIMRNEIAPYNAQSDWGNNFDAWFFVCSVFIASLILQNKVNNSKLISDRDEFLSECDIFGVCISDLNLDRISFDALEGVKAINEHTIISYGSLYKKLEKYLDAKYMEVYSDLEKRYGPTEKIGYTTILSFWSYLLFGSYFNISMWNRRCANTVIDSALVKITKFANNYDSKISKVNDNFDPTLN